MKLRLGGPLPEVLSSNLLFVSIVTTDTTVGKLRNKRTGTVSRLNVNVIQGQN